MMESKSPSGQSALVVVFGASRHYPTGAQRGRVTSMSPEPSIEMYVCAFHLGKWEADESVLDAYYRALDITAAQFDQMRREITML